ncbi:type II toxin-antitoxin system RelE/ParE family toxin [Rosenbergiella sp. S61]|uniref:Type II toxin-antitoxin system RelE/ParE family toxin n=1 Tax=Rosenbergiella gaditana TaxID=2726987 RepID=A0ABS5SYV0_9GAMM|nr:type II toxin-antitoxin system RelE/ParE family toxin [Rosenbergiella gaditana]MBT0725284.1 type II toxin-antitoxin system RelE/ParE family toxin [Rosenbergiella gaditana]
MSGEQNALEVFQSRRFEKALSKLPDNECAIVEDAIDFVIDNPTAGEKKKGDLSYLRVYKFDLNGRQCLLGYSFIESEFRLYLLSFGPHENFYNDQKRHRKQDIKSVK